MAANWLPTASLLLAAAIIHLPGPAAGQLGHPAAYQNPNHEPLREAVRLALDPVRTDALEETAEAAIEAPGANHRVVSLLGLSYPDFGQLAQVHPFNRLLSNKSDTFVPLLFNLLSLDPRHHAEVRELVFAPLANQSEPSSQPAWRMFKMMHWPKGDHMSGCKLSCLLVTPCNGTSFDVVVVKSSTAEVDIGDRDLLVVETKLLDQLGWPGRRESRLARVGHEAGLTEVDLDGVMAFAELNCLRKLGAHFEVAMDN